MADHSCVICGHAVAYEEAALVFNLLTEPPNPWIGHAHCAGECAYVIEFPELVRDGLDGPKGWYTHLQRKRWATIGVLTELIEAHEIAVARVPHTDRPLSLMRPVAQSIPRRRPRTPDNPRNITKGLRARVLERDEFRCRRCGNGPDFAPLVVDHIQPVAKGGTAAFENLQTLCAPCNAGKSDREPTPHDLGVRA